MTTATSPEWREASSAPRTGEHILITDLGRGGFGVCGGKRQDFATVVHWWDVAGEEGFYLSHSYPHNDADEAPLTFTHWRPLDVLGLPAPPSTIDEDDLCVRCHTSRATEETEFMGPLCAGCYITALEDICERKDADFAALPERIALAVEGQRIAIPDSEFNRGIEDSAKLIRTFAAALPERDSREDTELQRGTPAPKEGGA